MKKITTTHFTWLVADAGETTDIDLLKANLPLDSDILSYVLDKNEFARLEYDKHSQELLVIYNALRSNSKSDLTYQTAPVSFFVSGNQLLTIFGEDTNYLQASFERILQRRQDATKLEFVFTALFLISKAYFPVLEKLNRKSSELNRILRDETTKKSLLELSDLGTGLVYLASASKQNTLLLEQLQGQTFYKSLSEDELEQLEDAHIEARQLMEMTNLSAQVIEKLEGTYNNVLNNNLNDTMKTMTKLSILLAIPAIVTGFFGMNVELPSIFMKISQSWFWVIILSAGLWGVIALFLNRIMRKETRR